MEIFKALKGIFNTKNEKCLKMSDVLIGKEYRSYIDYLRNILRFEPILKDERNQIIFCNVFFEGVKFENFAFEYEKIDGIKRSKAVYLISTYEHKEQAKTKLEHVRKAFCAKYKIIGQGEDQPKYYPPIDILDCKRDDLTMSLGMIKLGEREFAYDKYGVVIALKPKN